MTEATERDWRETAYLTKSNWPEAIPPMEPKREWGPYSWSEPKHDNPHSVDDYHYTHPTAASVGELYMGDVCPYCGVPLKCDESVVNINGQTGQLIDVSPNEKPVPCYHRECWINRHKDIQEIENQTLGEWTE